MKKKFEVVIKETLRKVEVVYATSNEEAKEIVRSRYNKELIVLDCNDFDSVNFKVTEN